MFKCWLGVTIFLTVELKPKKSNTILKNVNRDQGLEISRAGLPLLDISHKQRKVSGAQL